MSDTISKTHKAFGTFRQAAQRADAAAVALLEALAAFHNEAATLAKVSRCPDLPSEKNDTIEAVRILLRDLQLTHHTNDAVLPVIRSHLAKAAA